MADPMIRWAWYWGTTVLLAVLLFFPVSRILWVMRVRALERRLGRKTTEDERHQEQRKARMVAALIAVTFAFLFNRTVGMPQ